MAEDKVVLGDGDAEHHHDNQDEPQSAPVGLSRRALRFLASRADRKSDRDLGLTELAVHRRLDHEGRGASAPGPDAETREAASFGRSMRMLEDSFPLRPAAPWQAAVALKKNPALSHGALLADGVGISAPGRQPYFELKVENPKSNSAAMTEYVRSPQRCHMTGR
ncbi:hypothetical protein [Bradyrhizobium sp. 25ACV]